MNLEWFVFFQAEDGIRDLVRSRGLGDVYKRQLLHDVHVQQAEEAAAEAEAERRGDFGLVVQRGICLLYTSDAADERSSVDLGGRRIIKKKTNQRHDCREKNDMVNVYVKSTDIDSRLKNKENIAVG